MAAWRDIDRQWTDALRADPFMTDDVMDAWGDKESAAEWALISVPVHTPQAFAAKIDHMRSEEVSMSYSHPGGVGPVIDVLADDAQRLAAGWRA